jgi:hypothetical protein
VPFHRALIQRKLLGYFLKGQLGKIAQGKNLLLAGRQLPEGLLKAR